MTKYITYNCLAGLFQIVGAFTAALLVVGLLTITGRTMSWYARPYLSIGLYGLPALAVSLFIVLRVSDGQHKALKSTQLVERVQFEGAKLNLTLMVLLTYMYGIRSNVLMLPWLGSAILGRWLLDRLYRSRGLGTIR